MSGASNLYRELGVRPVINALGHPTLLGGNTPSVAVREAMEEATTDYVEMIELLDVVGERIADMLDVEAAMVTPGCAAALSLGAAACITGADLEKIERIPDVTGMPHEFIIQRQLRVRYDRALTTPGGRLVEVGEEERTLPEHVESAIGPDTAGIHYLAGGLYDHPDERADSVSLEEIIDIAHSHGLPVIVDAAGQVYPTDRLSRYPQMGADLVCHGAKYFGAVNSSGLLTGKKELIDVARDHSFIGFETKRIRSFGRTMKMDRQSVVAVYAALREWLGTDHEERMSRYDLRLEPVRRALAGIEGLEAVDFPGTGLVEGLRIRVDRQSAGRSAEDVVNELRGGDPKIWVRQDGERGSFIIRMTTVEDGHEMVIAQRLREIFGL